MAHPVLITGGAGFIGSHLCDHLLAAGERVLCVDNFYTGAEGNLAHLVANPRFELLRHDIIEALPWGPERELSAIYNLACPASPVHYQRDPVQTTRTSVQGTLNLLELARRLQIPMLQASTSEVYGDPAVHPQREDYWGHVNPIGPRACYDEGKRCAETLCFDFHRGYGVAVKVARIFNTYGPRMSPEDGRVVSNFITQARVGAPLTIYGTGTQTRSFCYVDDLVRGLVALMGTPADFPGPVNLGNPCEITVLELARTVVELTGSESPIAFRALPTDDPQQRCPDISRAREVLRWQPEVPLRLGLERTVAYFAGLDGPGAS